MIPISKHMLNTLGELGEWKLVMRVILCDARTQLLAIDSQALKRKMIKHNARIKKHEARVDKLADDIPRIIMEHQNKK